MESVFSTLSRGRMCYWIFVSFVFVAALQSDIAACQKSCQPECTGAKTFVPDPLNCTQYYFCLADGSPADAALTCPNGTEFNPETASCEPEDPANPCTALCPIPQCSFKCNLTDVGVDLVRDPYDCGMYHVCTTGGTFGPFQCSANAPYFNGEICVEREDACCTQGCRLFCEIGASFAPDPLDCRKYYNCSASDLLTCSEGSTFDPAMGECVEGRPCRDCGGGTGVDATSTIVPANTTTTANTTKAPPTATAPPATTTTTVSTTNTTTPPTCIVPAVCSATGNFPICNYCHKQYYFCPRVGEKPSVFDCINDLVFNPVLSYPYCVLKDNCPFTSG